MRVMFIIDRLGGLGGAEYNLLLMARGLKERGHRVIICCLRGGELSKKMRNDGFYVEDLNLTRLFGLRGLKTLFRIFKITRRERVSVIMTYHEGSDFMGFLLAFFSKVPIVSSRRDMGIQLKTKHIWLYRLINGFFDHITAVSSAVKEFIVKTQYTKPSCIAVIYNGVTPSLGTDNPMGSVQSLNGIEFDEGCLNICSLAHIRPIKGQKVLIDAASLVASRFPNVRFFLVGKMDLNVSYFDEMKKQVRDLGLGNVVKFTGELSSDLIPTLLASMDISVLASFSEGMSNALLESMHAGKAVVATAVGGNPEVVEDGGTGYLVPPGDPHSMAQALLKLLTNPDLRREMGLRGKSHVESQFTVIRMVERYEDLLKYVYLRKKLEKWSGFRSGFRKTIQQVRSHTKVTIAYITYYSGLIRAFRWAKRALHLGKAKILCFHDVSEMAEGRSHFGVFMCPESFSKILNFLAKNYRTVSLEESVRLLTTGQLLADDVFALTFDDCYKGWINHVFPECQRVQVPYAIFVATGPVDSGWPLLYDTLIYLAENTWRKVADLSPWQLGAFLLDNPDNVLYAVEKIHECWRGRNREARDRFLKELSKYLGVSLNAENLQNMLLNWDDLRVMDEHGVAIGAHTVSHPLLSALTTPECFSEILQSKKRLEEELRHSIDFFAYPHGHRESYNHTVTKMVQDARFLNSFTLLSSDGKQYQSLCTSRRNVTNGMFANLNGTFCEPLLAMELSGLSDLLFGRFLK